MIHNFKNFWTKKLDFGNDRGNYEKGVSMYFAVLMTSVSLSMALGIAAIMLNQVKIVRNEGNSVVALAAADSGIEKALSMGNLSGHSSFTGYIDLNNNHHRDVNDSLYKIEIIAGGTDGCPLSSTYCIKSIGLYRGTRRAVQISR